MVSGTLERKREYQRQWMKSWRAALPTGERRELDRKKTLLKYGLSKEDFSQMLGEQMGCCKGCGCGLSLVARKEDSAVVDHDHKTGKVRGLLCNYCNTVLGYAKDSAARLRRLAVYLEFINE